MNQEPIKIETGIPLPPKRLNRNQSPITAVMKGLEIGHSIVIPDRFRQSAFHYARAAGISVVTSRGVECAEHEIRVWRTA